MPYILDFTVNSPDTTYKVPLEGSLYNVRLRWNTLSECWHCYFGQAGSDYSLQFKLRTCINFFNGYRAVSGIPPGILMLIDTEKVYGRPLQDNIGFGKRFQFLYIESTE